MRPRFVSSLYPIQQSLDTRQNTSSSKYNEKTSVCYLTMIIFAGRQSDTSTALEPRSYISLGNTCMSLCLRDILLQSSENVKR
jgi:hypothetical protein